MRDFEDFVMIQELGNKDLHKPGEEVLPTVSSGREL